MSIKKKYYKRKSTCEVTFTIAKELGQKSKTAHLVGDFNDWNTQATPMNKQKDGSFSITVEFKKGNEYQFKYLLNDETWINEPEADKLVPSYLQDEKNSEIII